MCRDFHISKALCNGQVIPTLGAPLTNAVNIIRNVFAVLGVLAVVVLINSLLTPPSGTGWVWSEESRINGDSGRNEQLIIERGKHTDASDLVRVMLHVNDDKFELWSGYMRSEPTVNWLDENTIGITYIEGDSHSYWPRVEMGGKSYNVVLSYRDKINAPGL